MSSVVRVKRVGRLLQSLQHISHVEPRVLAVSDEWPSLFLRYSFHAGAFHCIILSLKGAARTGIPATPSQKQSQLVHGRKDSNIEKRRSTVVLSFPSLIGQSQDNDFVRRVALSHGITGPMHLGLLRDCPHFCDTWRWIDLSDADYLNFGPGQSTKQRVSEIEKLGKQ